MSKMKITIKMRVLVSVHNASPISTLLTKGGDRICESFTKHLT